LTRPHQLLQMQVITEQVVRRATQSAISLAEMFVVQHTLILEPIIYSRPTLMQRNTSPAIDLQIRIDNRNTVGYCIYEAGVC